MTSRGDDTRHDEQAPAGPPGYDLIAEVGRGGSATVWLGVQRSMGRPVAVKVVPAPSAAGVERLGREARLLGHLQHPNIVTVIDLVEQDGALYVVQPLFEGGTLASLLERDGALPPSQAVAVLAPVARALATAHARGVVHRDVKPSNVLLTIDGTPALADFGLAFESDATRLTSTGNLLGTIGYVAPELLDGAQPHPSADAYAFGVLAYQTLAGRRPYDGSSIFSVADAARRGDAPRLDEVVPGLPAGLAEVVTALLHRDPAQRPADLGAVAAQLEALCMPERVRPTPLDIDATRLDPDHIRSTEERRASQPGTRRRRRHLVPIAAALVLAVAMVAAALAVGSREGQDGEETIPSQPLEVASPAATTVNLGSRLVEGIGPLTRTWVLDGEQGTILRHQIRLQAERDLTVVHTEAIPKELAATTDEVTFQGADPTIVERDPVVAWRLELKAGESKEVAWQVGVPAEGLDRARVDGFEALRAEAERLKGSTALEGAAPGAVLDAGTTVPVAPEQAAGAPGGAPAGPGVGGTPVVGTPGPVTPPPDPGGNGGGGGTTTVRPPPPPLAPPGVVGSPRVTSVAIVDKDPNGYAPGLTQATLSWAAPSSGGAATGHRITAHFIDRHSESVIGRAKATQVFTVGAATTHTVTIDWGGGGAGGMQDDGTWRFTVVASNAAGSGAASAPAAAVVPRLKGLTGYEVYRVGRSAGLLLNQIPVLPPVGVPTNHVWSQSLSPGANTGYKSVVAIEVTDAGCSGCRPATSSPNPPS